MKKNGHLISNNMTFDGNRKRKEERALKIAR